MKIAELHLWKFRCFGSSTDKDTAGEVHPVTVHLDTDITALIGRNGSGKSALLAGLQRLFGETRDERLVRAEDFFVAPGQTLEASPKRQLFVEALIVFPEIEA